MSVTIHERAVMAELMGRFFTKKAYLIENSDGSFVSHNTGEPVQFPSKRHAEMAVHQLVLHDYKILHMKVSILVEEM